MPTGVSPVQYPEQSSSSNTLELDNSYFLVKLHDAQAFFSAGLCWLLGTSVQKLAVCTSPIFLFFYFPLVKYMELLGEWRTDLRVFGGHVRKMPREPGKNAVCLSGSQGTYQGREQKNTGRL